MTWPSSHPSFTMFLHPATPPLSSLPYPPPPLLLAPKPLLCTPFSLSVPVRPPPQSLHPGLTLCAPLLGPRSFSVPHSGACSLSARRTPEASPCKATVRSKGVPCVARPSSPAVPEAAVPEAGAGESTTGEPGAVPKTGSLITFMSSLKSFAFPTQQRAGARSVRWTDGWTATRAGARRPGWPQGLGATAAG